jgi:hypothetical protein
MVAKMVDLFFGCRHRQLTRPMTPFHKPGTPPGNSYVACLGCGRQFHYDVVNMRMGSRIHVVAPACSSERNSFQVQ